MKFLSRLFTLICAAWLFSFVFFLWQINSFRQVVLTKPEAIVVLTGGSNRIEEGLDIMSKYGCQNLFISGVNRDVSRHDILGRIQKNSNVRECDLELGYTARNTHENAQEVITWLKRRQYKNIVLVTAHYHLPRSLLEFKAMAPELEITPYAVYPNLEYKTDTDSTNKRIFLVLREFHKYLFVWIRTSLLHK